MTAALLTRRVLTIRGRVQGVGFRWFARAQAEVLGLSGWARNLGDGSVEVEVEGPGDKVETFAAEMRRGPAGARVDSLEARTLPRTGKKGFEIRA